MSTPITKEALIERGFKAPVGSGLIYSIHLPQELHMELWISFKDGLVVDLYQNDGEGSNYIYAPGCATMEDVEKLVLLFTAP